MDRTLQPATGERGPWSTGLALVVALAPLAMGLAVGLLVDRKIDVGPFTPNQLLFWVILPLAGLYPTIAAIARRMAYAPTTVLVVASIAPALVYAARLFQEPLPTTRQGHPVPITFDTVLGRALPPALLAVGAYLAIEIATAAIRRGVAIGFFGAIVAAVVFAGSLIAPLYVLAASTT